jgi:hypothetical protein
LDTGVAKGSLSKELAQSLECQMNLKFGDGVLDRPAAVAALREPRSYTALQTIAYNSKAKKKKFVTVKIPLILLLSSNEHAFSKLYISFNSNTFKDERFMLV